MKHIKTYLFCACLLLVTACQDESQEPVRSTQTSPDAAVGSQSAEKPRAVDTHAFNAVPDRMYPGYGVPLNVINTQEKLTSSAGRILISGNRYYFIAPIEATTVQFELLDKEGNSLVSESREVVMPQRGSLDLTKSEDTSIAGMYGEVNFEASAAQDGSAKARYWVEQGPEVSIVVRDLKTAELHMKGMSLDGRGTLTASESSALSAFSTGPLARAITNVPLELRCQESISQPALAALLFPWQMILKYAVVDRKAVISHFMVETRCPGQSPEGDVELQAEGASTIGIWWSSDQVIPSAGWYFPFDGAGQLELGAGQ